MKSKHMFLKQCALFVALFGVSGGATLLYYSQTSGSSNQPGTGDVVRPDDGNQQITPAEALFMDMTTNLKQFNLSGGIYFTYGENQLDTEVTLNGSADISDFNSIKIDAAMDINCSGLNINGNLGYYDSNIYVDYNNTHVKLPEADLMEFINILSTDMDVNIKLPDELVNLDLNEISNNLSTMTPAEGPNGTKIFELPISKDVTVVFKSNANYQFTGVRTNKFFYNDLYCYADFDVERVKDVNLVNPELRQEAPNYQLFTPAFGLVEGMYNVFGKNQNTINLVVDLQREAEGKLNPVVTLDTDISYDRTSGLVNMMNKIKETTRVHKFDMQVNKGGLYINTLNLNKICFQGESVFEAITYLANQITDEELNALLDKIASSMNGVDPTPVLDTLMSLNKWIEGTTITENGVDIIFNLKAFDPALDKLTISLTKDQKTFTGIHLNNFKFQGMIANVDMVVAPYVMPTIETASYVALDPAMSLVQTIYQLSKKTQFRLEMNGLVDNAAPAAKDITIGGGLQFDVAQKFGYGDATIVDTTGYNHNIKADFRTDKQILFAYNDETRAKMTSGTINEVAGFVTELVQTKDDHFFELFGNIIETLQNTPIYKAISGDYGLLFATPAISNITVTDTLIGMNMSGALIGMPEVDMRIEIRYDDQHLYGMDITNIKMGDQTISFSLDLKGFKPELEAKRLDPYATYFDLTEIKTLLSLGYNTTVPNDFHIAGSISVSLLSIINVDLPVDIRVFNDKGNVSVAVDIQKIPQIILVNKNKEYVSSKDRSAQFYYKDNMIYAKRSETVTGGKNYSLTSRIALNEFLKTENIMYYLLDFTLGLWQTYVDQVNNAINAPKDPSAPAAQMRYEKILTDFAWNSYDQYYHISLNMKELAQNPKLNNLNLKICTDMTLPKPILNAIEMNWNVVPLVNLKGRIALVDFGQPVDLTTMTNFIASMQNSPLGEVVKTVK